MAIDSVLNPVGMAKKLSVPQLQKAIQDGIIPPYVGIPVLQEKVQMEERMRNAAAQPQQGQPTVAQQVMSQAQGLNAMPSGLPEQFAGGGIVAFAEGDLVEEDDEDDKFEKSIQSAQAQMDQYRKYMDALREMETPKSVETFPRFEAEEVTKGVSVKQGDRPAQSIEQTEKRVSRPGNLDELLALVQQKESGGRRYDKQGNLLTSPKGAMGEMQVMPMTARDPGFGIRPAREGDPDDLARVGREYYAKMLERYGDPKVAAIAYNMGPGNTDKWLMAGADMSRLPEETRKYSQGFAKGGILSFSGAGTSLVPYVPQSVSSLDPYAWAARNPAIVEGAGTGIRALAGRTFMPAAVGLGVYDIGRTVMEKKQKEEREKYGVEPEPTEEELAAAARPAFYPSMSRKQQLGQGLKPMAPLTYTPAGVQTYGERPNYTVPDAQKPVGPYTDEATRLAARYPAPSAAPDFADSDAAEQADRMTGGTEPQATEAEKDATAESPFAASLRERLTKGYEKLAKQEESDKYLSLLAAGLGMMGGTSPFAAANIGAGGLKGIQAMQQAEASRAAQERGLMSAELGLERYGQYGALQKEQALMRKQLAEAETQRKREATEGTLAERANARQLREQQMYGNQLKEMERLAQTAALAREKGAILPDQKEGIQAKALEQLRSDPGYRRLYKLVHGFDPAAVSGNTIQWDQLGK